MFSILTYPSMNKVLLALFTLLSNITRSYIGGGDFC